MTITDVQTQRRRETRRSIFVDGEFALGVSEEIYVRHALFIGREVDEAFLVEVARDEDLYNARQRSLRWLGVRMRSSSEMEKKLREKEFPPEVIAETIGWLREYGMIDDSAFARAYINDRLLKRSLGRARLAQELRGHGVSAEEADRALDEAIGTGAELDNARRAAERKLRMMRVSDRASAQGSLVRFLQGRGFPWEVIRQVLTEIDDRLGTNSAKGEEGE